MNQSVWTRVKIPSYPKLNGAHQVDVVVIGAGITGLSCAYYLREAGIKVCVLEKNQISSAETSVTTAHVTAVTDERLSEIADSFGLENAIRVWKTGAVAISSIEKIINKYQIECEFRRVPGYLFESLMGSDHSKELEKFQNDLRVAKECDASAAFESQVPIFFKSGIRFNNQAKFHPLLYLRGLAKAIQEGGGEIFEHSEVKEVQESPLRVVGEEFSVECKDIIIATHVPLIGKLGWIESTMFQTKIAPYSTYAIGCKIPKDQTPPEICLWDTSDPYFYLRIDRGVQEDYAIFGGCDHKTGQQTDTEKPYGYLFNLLQRYFSSLELDTKWSGQVIETHDGLPFIGEIQPHQFIATGFSGNGMTFGTLSGWMAQDWILGRKNNWTGLFSPHRKEIRAQGPWNYVKENLDYPFYLIKDAMLPWEENVDELKKGQAKVLRISGRKAACFRDEKNALHCVSAVCSHMGCTVHWNKAEQTWDCPCHGSRFTPDGVVIGGPAEKPLSKIS